MKTLPLNSFLISSVLILIPRPLSLRAQEAVIELDPAQTHVQFTLSDVLHTVHGAFRLKQGTIRYDFATGRASGAVVIDGRSGDRGSGARGGRTFVLKVGNKVDIDVQAAGRVR